MSIFKKDEPPLNGALKDASTFQVLKTGGEVDGIVAAFLPHCADKDAAVRAAYDFALVDLGNRQPALTLSSLVAFMAKNRLEVAHRVQLLTALATIVEMKRDAINAPLADDLIRFLTREMIKDVEPVNELAQPCSSALVSLSVSFCPAVLDALLANFKHGEVPHYYLVKTLSDVAVAAPTLFTLRLSDVLSRTTPCLGVVKKAPMRWVFATALGHYADALQHWTANATEAEAGAIERKSFELEFLSGFDILFNRWLPDSPEVKVRLTIVEALGSISRCLDRPSLEQRLGKVVPRCLEMYKKERVADHLPISVGLNYLVTEACKSKPAIEPLLPLLLSSLHPLICRPVDPAVPSTAKNHNELLRVVEVMARAELEPVLTFIVNRFQLKEKESRVGSLVILRHLVNSMDAVMTDRRPLVMSSVVALVGEQDVVVKKAMMQLIVSLSNQGYLAMEGGQALIKFILQQCALPVDEQQQSSKAAVDEASPLQLRNAGVHILYVMATKVPSAKQVMWPYLLELLNDDAYNRAILVLLRCIAALSNEKREDKADDYFLNYDSRQDIPRPQAILARLMCLLAEPYRRDIGVVTCKAMLGLGPLIHAGIGEYWDEAVPALLEYLEAHNEQTLQVQKWQDTLLKVWRESINRVKDQKWLQDTADKLLDQFRLYRLPAAHREHGGDKAQAVQHDSSIHRAIHRYLGYVLSRVDSKAIVEKTFDAQWQQLNHRSDAERTGFAQGAGLAAYTHIDTILTRLTDRIGRKEKKAGFFANLLKDDDGIGDEIQLATVVLSYGYVAAYSQTELFLSRVDVYVLHNTLPLMLKARSHLFRAAVVQALELMGKALQFERLPEGKQNFKLTQRDELLHSLIHYLDDRPGASKQQPKGSEAVNLKLSGDMRYNGLQCVATLIRLNPPISSELRTKLLLAVLPYFSLTDQQLAEDGRDKRREDEALLILDKRDEPTAEQIQQQLNALLAAIVQTDPALTTALDSLKLLEPYLVSVKVLERQRASGSFLVVLKEFVRTCVAEDGQRVRRDEKVVPLLGSFVSMVLPRVLDSDAEVRSSSAENVQALLYINQLLGNPDQPKPSQEVKLITECKPRLQQPAFPPRLEAADDLASVLVSLLSVAETSRLLLGLFTAFLDADADAALGASFLWWRLVHLQGRQLASELRVLLTGVLSVTKQCKQRDVLEYAWRGLRELAALHFAAVSSQLLEATVPLPKESIDLFTALVHDSASSPLPLQFIEHLCAILNDTPIDKDKPAPVVATATAALKEVGRVDSLRAVMVSAYAGVVCTILMRIGVCNDVDSAGTADAIAALKAFLTLTGDVTVVVELEAAGVWATLGSSAHYDDGVTLVCRSLCVHHPDLKATVLSYLSKFFSQQSYTGQRIVATAMLAELVTHSSSSVPPSPPASSSSPASSVPGPSPSPAPSPSSAAPNPLLREIIKYLLPRVADKVEKVRKHALRGLGNLVTVWSDETAEMATSILSSLISASEDSDSEVAGEAVASLTRIVGVVSDSTMSPMLISVCWRLRPAFDRKEDNVRSSAFTLFGALCRFGGSGASGGQSETRDFMEQVHVNLPIFIIHLQDESAVVRQACWTGLRQLSTLLDTSVVAILQDGPAAGLDVAAYDELVYRLCPRLAELYGEHVRGYIESSVVYFSSKWVELRGASALFACLLLAHCSESVRKSITVSALVSGLLKLLDEPSAAVRSKAVKGLAYLHDV